MGSHLISSLSRPVLLRATTAPLPQGVPQGRAGLHQAKMVETLDKSIRKAVSSLPEPWLTSPDQSAGRGLAVKSEAAVCTAAP